MKMVRLSALRTGRLHPPVNIPGIRLLEAVGVNYILLIEVSKYLGRHKYGTNGFGLLKIGS
jgi:hypothetical protein